MQFKQLEALTKEELQELISYTAPGGEVTIYYSHINYLCPETRSMDYSNSGKVELNADWDAVVAGKARYEAYKLFCSNIDADRLKADIISDIVDSRLDEVKTKVEEYIVKADNSLSDLFYKLGNDISAVSKNSSKLSSALDSILKVADISDYDLDRVATNLRKAKIEFEDINTELKKLFKER